MYWWLALFTGFACLAFWRIYLGFCYFCVYPMLMIDAWLHYWGAHLSRCRIAVRSFVYFWIWGFCYALIILWTNCLPRKRDRIDYYFRLYCCRRLSAPAPWGVVLMTMRFPRSARFGSARFGSPRTTACFFRHPRARLVAVAVRIGCCHSWCQSRGGISAAAGSSSYFRSKRVNCPALVVYHSLVRATECRFRTDLTRNLNCAC